MFAKLIEQALAEKEIKKGEFYDAVGITATALYGWKNGSTPKPETVATIAKYLDLELFPYELAEPKEDNLRDVLQKRSDLRTLVLSAKELQPSAVYAIIAEIEKRKEENS